jgi:hypothetical protein
MIGARRFAQFFGFAVISIPLLLTGCAAVRNNDAPYTVVLDGLDEPHGLSLSANGTLCVAEAGRAPADQAAGDQPATLFADTGAVTCLDAAGQRKRVISALPHTLYSANGISVGPAAVAEMDGSLYVLTGEGYEDASRKLLHIGDAGQPEKVADFLAFAAGGQPLSYIQPASIAANPYAMIPDPVAHRFLVTDGASGQVMAAGLDGKISIYSPVGGHEVLTGIARGPDELIYVASFSQLPHEAGKGSIVRIHPNGASEVALGGLTTPIALAFDRDKRLYVLEFVKADPGQDPYRGKTGRLLRFAPAGGGWGSDQVLMEGIP